MLQRLLVSFAIKTVLASVRVTRSVFFLIVRLPLFLFLKRNFTLPTTTVAFRTFVPYGFSQKDERDSFKGIQCEKETQIDGEEASRFSFFIPGIVFCVFHFFSIHPVYVAYVDVRLDLVLFV